MFCCRERQLKLEKVRATQQHIEEFKRQQAEWRRMEQEKIEAENRHIMEFASRQQQMEEIRMAKIREREEAKENLHKIVETSLPVSIYLSSQSMTHAYSISDTKYHFSLFSCSCLRKLKRRGSSVKRWSESVRSCISRNRKRQTGGKKLCGSLCYFHFLNIHIQQF